MPDKITSLTNAKVKRIAELTRKAKARRKEQCFVLEGERSFADMPADCLREVYVTEAFLRGAEGRAAQRLQTLPVPYTEVTEEVMRKMSDTQTPQGVLCVAAMPSYREEDLLRGTPLLLILEDIQDPGNLGTMLRTAEAAGATGVLMSAGTADLFQPKTVRSTMSAVFRMPYLYTEDLPGTLRSLTERGIALYAAHLKARQNYDEADYRGPCGFLIGNEGNGLKEETAALAQHKILIPMQGEIESLNAAMAAGILLFEAAGHRRRGQRQL